MKLEFSRQIFDTPSNIKFHENPSSWSRVVPCGWTDRRMDMRRLTDALRNFANAPNIELCFACPSVCEIPNYGISYWRAVARIQFHFLALQSKPYFEVIPKHNLILPSKTRHRTRNHCAMWYRSVKYHSWCQRHVQSRYLRTDIFPVLRLSF